MASYRVLIVDDQRELRLMLKSAVETLGSEFEVIAVPSGEEAFLEIRGQDVDLLVSDIMLPGISGLELLAKVRARNPNLKVILVTGTVDAQVRRDVADAGADAFFLKPMDPADFLDSVERTLGLIESEPLESTILATGKPSENVSERLVNLRNELDSFSAVLLDDRGRVLAGAGDLPDATVESSLLPSLMAVFSASKRVARFLGTNPPNDLSYFSGPKYDILLAHVGESYALMVAVNPIHFDEDLSTIVRGVYTGVGDLHEILLNMGVRLKSDDQPIVVKDEPEDEIATEIMAEEAPLIEALFQGVDANIPKTEDVDEFWNTITADEASNSLQNADALTYEQALQLGLAPDENEE
jgi:CheY-like chemotaxis protein